MSAVCAADCVRPLILCVRSASGFPVPHPCRRYRKPRSSYKYMRPEMQQRHAAFKRGSAYLERYCQLVAFASYLEVRCAAVGGWRLSACLYVCTWW